MCVDRAMCPKDDDLYLESMQYSPSAISIVSFCYYKTVVMSVELSVNSVSLFSELASVRVVVGIPEV